MHVLFVTPYMPSPPGFGAQRRLDGLIRGVAKKHEVALVSFVAPDETKQSAIEATREYCGDLTTVDFDMLGIEGLPKRLLQLRSLASTKSFEHLLMYRPEFRRVLTDKLRSRSFDIVQVEFCTMAIYDYRGAGNGHPRLVLDEHNIEYDLSRRTADAADSLQRKLYARVNWRKLRREEQRSWRQFDAVALTSGRDEQVVHQDVPGTRTQVVPNAVDLEGFRPGTDAPEPATLLFFGAMNYHPNIDGVHYFVEHIFPKIKERCPRAKLVVIGQKPPDSVRALASDSIEIKGFVDDPRPYLDRATLVVVPLRIGGGTRFKIVEAMAQGKAIVSTRLGAEGIDVEHDKNIMLADDPQQFAGSVAKLLSQPELALRLGRQARALAESGYGWDAAVGKLETLYSALLEAGR